MTKCYHDNVTADICQVFFLNWWFDAIRQKDIENKAQNGRKEKRLSTCKIVDYNSN